MKYAKGAFPFKEDNLNDLTGRPTRFDNDPSFAEQGKRKLTPPMEGSLSDGEKKEISNEQDNKELDKHEDEMGY